MKDLLRHPWLTVRTQFVLGAVFLAAALPKLMDPPGFVRAMWNYQLFPGWSLQPAALVLPWLELLCGLALCLGLWTRAAAAWLGALLLVFIAALSINLARHHPVDCGCFGTHVQALTEAERMQDLRWTILRDLGLLLLAAQILAAGAQTSPRVSKDSR